MDTYAYDSENQLFSDPDSPGNEDYSSWSERESGADSFSPIEHRQKLPMNRASPREDTPVRQRTVFKH